MKALSIRQPWAELIMRGVKTIELRKYTPHHRGLLAIHAGKSVASAFCKKYDIDPNGLPKGAIIGTVEFTDVIHFTPELWSKLRNQHLCDSVSYGMWQGWKLQNPKRLSNPLPCRGLPGIFEVPSDLVVEGFRNKTKTNNGVN